MLINAKALSSLSINGENQPKTMISAVRYPILFNQLTSKTLNINWTTSNFPAFWHDLNKPNINLRQESEDLKEVFAAIPFSTLHAVRNQEQIVEYIRLTNSFNDLKFLYIYFPKMSAWTLSIRLKTKLC